MAGYTANDVAERLEIERPIAYSFLQVLEAVGLAKRRGQRSSGTGRPRAVFYLEMGFAERFKRKLDESGMSDE